MLEAVADAIDAARDELVPLAHEETNLAVQQLTMEVGRTSNQLRMFARVVRDGSHLEAIIDSADPDVTPPKPEVRRVLHPLGPVAVYSASNFPFAFSVAGGDTASRGDVGKRDRSVIGGDADGAFDGTAHRALGPAAHYLDRQAPLRTARNHELELPVGRGLL